MADENKVRKVELGDATITHDQLVERMTRAMQEMSGEELADLYNGNFGSDMIYIGDSLFEQLSDTDEDDDQLVIEPKNE